MIVIDNVIVSDELVEREFVCDLNTCKGACCVQGESGAPLEKKEMEQIETVYEKVKPYITELGVQTIEVQGKYVVDEKGQPKTPLINNAACAYVNFDNRGIAYCGIQKAYQDGKIDFEKPISCHLYPIRIKKQIPYDLLEYERWEICKPACKKGRKLEVRVFEFLKDPLIRKYGEEFYDQLYETANYLKSDE